MALVPGPRVRYSFTNPVLNPHDPSQSSESRSVGQNWSLCTPGASHGRIREPIGYPGHAALPAAPALTSTSCVIGVRVALPQVLGADGDVSDLPRPIKSAHALGNCKADGVDTPRGPGVCSRVSPYRAQQAGTLSFTTHSTEYRDKSHRLGQHGVEGQWSTLGSSYLTRAAWIGLASLDMSSYVMMTHGLA